MSTFLFPFEIIDKGSNIALYGAGIVGHQYIQQIEKTNWVNVVCVLDKNYMVKKTFHPAYIVYPPEYIKGINENVYQYVLVASEMSNHNDDIRQTLIALGVPDNKILFHYDRCLKDNIQESEIISSDDGDDILKIVIISSYGYGDALNASVLAKEIRKMIKSNIIIDFSTSMCEAFAQYPYFNNVKTFDAISFINARYDVVIFAANNPIVKKVNIEKTKRFSRRLYTYLANELRIIKNLFCDSFKTSDYYSYCDLLELRHKKRIEGLDLEGLIPLNRSTPVYEEWPIEAFDCLMRFGLKPNEFITIGNGIENTLPVTHSKAWPVTYFSELSCLIKEKYPQIIIVSVGENAKFGQIEGIDLDLTGKTTICEIKVILKYSLIHIGTEGGLVHLKHFLYGKSIVVFGGTSISLHGYDNNCNLRSNLPCCNGSCFLFKIDYFKSVCPFSEIGDYAKCMKLLSPQIVIRSIIGLISTIKVFDYQLCTIDFANLHKIIKSNDKIALINRKYDRFVFQYSKIASSITVYDRDLSADNIPADYISVDNKSVNGKSTNEMSAYNIQNNDKPIDALINCKYIDIIKKYNAIAEYGFIYNIPSEDEQYDIVFNFTLCDEVYPDKAMHEMLRITKINGCVVALLADGNLSLTKKFQHSESYINKESVITSI